MLQLVIHNTHLDFITIQEIKLHNFTTVRTDMGSNDISLHDVELSGNNRCQQIEINSYPDSPLFISIPTDPVKRVCYADDLTVWASGVHIPDLEVSINNYLEEITAYLKDNSLLISAPKSSVTLLTPDTHQAKIHPRIFIENSHLPLVKCPRILGVYLDPSLSFNKYS